MKKLSLFLLSCIFVYGACTKSETDVTEPEIPPTLGDAVWVDAEAGSFVSYTYDFSENWQISNTFSSWLTVSPLSGFSGENELTFTAKTENSEITENTGYVDVTVGSETLRLYIFQRGARGLEVDATSFTFFSKASDCQFTVLANEEFSVESAASWLNITVPEDGEIILLDDGVSESELKSYTVTLSATQNDESEQRVADIRVSSDNANASVSLTQYPTIEAEYNSTFYRHSLAMRFTATWCGWCPMMAESFNQAVATLPERIVPFTIHASSSDLYSEGATTLANLYDIEGYPSGYINGYGYVKNYDVSVASNMIVSLANEATQNLPSKTAIMGAASYNNGTVDLDIYVAAKEAGDYTLHVYLMESGIVASQTSYDSNYPGGNNYVHNYVERCAITGISGESFASSANSITNFEYSYTVPSGRIVDSANTYVVVFVTYSGSYNGSVNYAVYQNYSGYIVDNAVKLSYDEPTLFTYED